MPDLYGNLTDEERRQRLNAEGRINTSPSASISDEQLIAVCVQLIEKLSGTTFYAYQRVFAWRICEAVLLGEAPTITGLWSRQCLVRDTVVLRRDGTACRIQDHEDAWCTGLKRVYRIHAKNGFWVDATANHPFWTKRGWVKAGQLREDDWLCVLREWDAWGKGKVTHEYSVRGPWSTQTRAFKFKLTEKHGRLLGYLSADGYAFEALKRGQSIKFTNINEKYLCEVEDLVGELFPDVKTTRYPKGNGFDILCTVKERSNRFNSLRAFLEAMRPDDGFPTALFDAPKRVAKAFLNRLYSSDGCAWTARDGSRSQIDLSLGQTDVYGRYCQAMLAKLGIASTIKEETMAGGPFRRLVIADREHQGRFLRRIGPIFGKEEACAKIVSSYGDRWSNRKTEPAPDGPDGEKREWVKLKRVDTLGKQETWDVTYPEKGWFFAHGIQVKNSGKTETVACVAIGLAVFLPSFAAMMPNDPRVNAFQKGFFIGVYAPKQQQADISFARMRRKVMDDDAAAVMEDPEINVQLDQNRNDRLAFSNGSVILSRTASPETHVEGETHHLVFLEESQKISHDKVEKEISPMLASTFGTMVCIGTAGTDRGAFHTFITSNERHRINGGKRNHFEFPWKVIVAEKRRAFDRDGNQFHLNYERFVQSKIKEQGENSPQFRMNFCCIWGEASVVAVRLEVFRRSAILDRGCNRWRSGVVKVGGLDIGKSEDDTVCTCVEVPLEQAYMAKYVLPGGDEDRQILRPKVIVDWLMLQGAFEGASGQYEAIVEWLRDTGMQILCIDATGKGDVVFERLDAMIGGEILCLPFVYGMVSKTHLTKYFLGEVNSGRLRYVADAETRERIEYQKFVQQMEDLEKDETNGMTRMRAPTGEHDDFPNSAALACWAEKNMDALIMPEVTSAPMETLSQGLGGSMRSLGGGRLRGPRLGRLR